MEISDCATCADGQHATEADARACARRSAEAAQARADELPMGIYEKNGQRFRVEKSGRNGHRFARLQDPRTRRYEYVPGAIRTLAREHLVRECTSRLELMAASREAAA